MSRGTLPLIAIYGPTASGKTSLAIRIAQAFDGEIICADSRTIYKGMDIGTAKPTMEERAGIPHWGLDIVEPGEHFTVVDFKQYAETKIDEIRARGRVPIIVGGTGLYMDSIVFDFSFPATVRAHDKFENMSLDKLHKYCSDNNITLPENYKNKRYVINTIRRQGTTSQRRSTPIRNSIIVGISTEKEILRARIALRSEQIFDDGVVEEARQLASKYGWDSEAMTGNIYPLVCEYDAGMMTFEHMKERFRTLDWQLAKRQLTWLKRNEHIVWLPLEEAYTYLARELASANKS